MLAVAGVLRRWARVLGEPRLGTLARHWWRDQESRPAVIRVAGERLRAAGRTDEACALVGWARGVAWRAATTHGRAA